MRVKSLNTIPGRGIIARVELGGVAAVHVKPGVLVHQKDSAWRVKGVEFGSVRQTEIGLIFEEKYGAPSVGEVQL